MLRRNRNTQTYVTFRWKRTQYNRVELNGRLKCFACRARARLKFYFICAFIPMSSCWSIAIKRTSDWRRAGQLNRISIGWNLEFLSCVRVSVYVCLCVSLSLICMTWTACVAFTLFALPMTNAVMRKQVFVTCT